MARPTIQEELEREWRGLPGRLAPEGLPHPRFVAQRMFRLGPAAVHAQLEDALRAWKELLASPLIEKYLDRYVNSGWTLKELLAHLGCWAGEFRRQVETAARGESFDYFIPYGFSPFGPTEWNQAEVEKRRGRSLAEIRHEFERETRRLQELVLETPRENLQAETEFPMAPLGDPKVLLKTSPVQVAAMKCIHNLHHFAQIQQWLARVEMEEKRAME